MNDTHQDARSHRRPPAAAILIVPLVAALILTLFAWPASRLEPRDLPVGVAGPPAATQQIAGQLAAQDGKFEVHRYAGEPPLARPSRTARSTARSWPRRPARRC